MKIQLQIPSKNISKMLELLAKKMKTSLIRDHAECELRIPINLGKGSIHCLEYDGVSMLLFNCQLKSDLKIDFKASKEQPLRFNYCVEGSVRHIFFHEKLNYDLEKYTGSITANPISSNEAFHFPAKIKLLITQIQINRQEYFYRIEDELPSLPQPLANTFADLAAKETFFYRSNYDVGIVDCIQSVQRTSKTGLIRSLFLESKTIELLYQHLKQYQDNFIFPSKNEPLKKEDEGKILLARDLLVKHLAKKITIPSLAKLVGINQQKLKMGFKIIFNKTIATYIREERLEKARQQLATATMTIKETSEHIGYANQSHFSRRFKEKYGLLPKEFKNKVMYK